MDNGQGPPAGPPHPHYTPQQLEVAANLLNLGLTQEQVARLVVVAPNGNVVPVAPHRELTPEEFTRRVEQFRRMNELRNGQVVFEQN